MPTPRSFARPASSWVTLCLLVLAACSKSTTDPGPDPTPVVGSISIATESLTFEALGDTVTLVPVVRDVSGRTMTGVSVTWASSDPAVASVSPAGRVTTTGNGEATITATVTSFSASVQVTVAQVVTDVAIVTQPDTLRGPGQVLQLAAALVDANGNEVVTPTLFAGPSRTDPPTEPVFEWSSSDPGVLEFRTSAGEDRREAEFVAAGEGTATVSATYEDATSTVSVTVAYDRVAASVDVELFSETVFSGARIFATAIVRNAYGFEVADSVVSWSTSDASLTIHDVVVDSLGRSTVLVNTPGTPGAFTIQASLSGGAIIGEAPVTIVAPLPAQGISIDFSVLPGGGATCTVCDISTEFSPWGISFRFVDMVASGGDGYPDLTTSSSDPTMKYLNNDSFSNLGFPQYLTGSHLLTFSVAISSLVLDMQNEVAPVRAYRRVAGGQVEEIKGVVVVRRTSPRVWFEHVIHSPVPIDQLKFGPYGGLLGIDNIAY